MGRFDIEYSKYIPTASPGLAKANIDVDQGEAELSRSIFNFGKTLRSLGQNMQNAQDVMDVSDLQRQDQEDYSASMAEANKIGYYEPSDEREDE